MPKVIINGNEFEIPNEVSNLIMLISMERDALKSLVESQSFRAVPQAGEDRDTVANQDSVCYL